MIERPPSPVPLGGAGRQMSRCTRGSGSGLDEMRAEGQIDGFAKVIAKEENVPESTAYRWIQKCHALGLRRGRASNQRKERQMPNSPPMERTATPGVYKRGGRYVVTFRDPSGRQRKRFAKTLVEAAT